MKRAQAAKARDVRDEALEAAAVARRSLWSRSPRSTHCKRGHEFQQGSYYVTSSGSRSCKECKRGLAGSVQWDDYVRSVRSRTHCAKGHVLALYIRGRKQEKRCSICARDAVRLRLGGRVNGQWAGKRYHECMRGHVWSDGHMRKTWKGHRACRTCDSARGSIHRDIVHIAIIDPGYLAEAVEICGRYGWNVSVFADAKRLKFEKLQRKNPWLYAKLRLTTASALLRRRTGVGRRGAQPLPTLALLLERISRS